MIVQNSPTPWVTLALIVMAGCLGAGMMAGEVGPFNNEHLAARMQITQTQASINSAATQANLAAQQTQQAPIAQQTQIVAAMTAAPLLSMATSAAEQELLRLAYANATQTAISSQAQNAQMSSAATQTALKHQSELQKMTGAATGTAMVQEQMLARNTNLSTNLAILLVAITVCLWIVVSVAIRAQAARIRAMEARARLLAEQRELTTLRIRIQSMKGGRGNQHPLPTSLMSKIPDNGKNLPKAE